MKILAPFIRPALFSLISIFRFVVFVISSSIYSLSLPFFSIWLCFYKICRTLAITVPNTNTVPLQGIHFKPIRPPNCKFSFPPGPGAPWAPRAQWEFFFTIWGPMGPLWGSMGPMGAQILNLFSLVWWCGTQYQKPPYQK